MDDRPHDNGGIQASRRDREHVVGCLLGGAVGDALGAPVEFWSLRQIRQHYGAAGIADLAPAYGRIGAITDDTQMTLFTAEGLLRAAVRADSKGTCAPEVVMHHAYVRWLWTQGEHTGALRPGAWKHGRPDGWLATLPELRSRRAPGDTCLAALRRPDFGTPEHPLNQSKGCGGVMRVAPVGLFQRMDAFRFGCQVAAITHGHPTGFLAAGFLARLVREIIEGASLPEAIASTLAVLEHEPAHEETSRAVERAVAAARSRAPTAETVESLGGGWVAEEALAIALFCALVADDNLEAGVKLAVNHSGDSDSTGAITGSILGALLGVSAIPARWLGPLELRREIEAVALDLLTESRDDEGWWQRYPGW